MSERDQLRRIAAEAKMLLDEARAVSGRREFEGEQDDVGALSSIMVNLLLDERRRATFVLGQSFAMPPGAVYYIAGWHIPGHVENGRPVVFMGRVDDAGRAPPPDSLPIMLFAPAGRLEEARKTFPHMGVAGG